MKNLNIADIMNSNTLAEHVKNKLVNTSHHPDYSLTLYKYSQNAVIQKVWDEVTLQTRGLIVDDSGNIVARGFDKFFNLSEHPEGTLSNDSQGIVMPKMDGSLGIVFFYDNQWHVATAGSFSSDQAIHATALFRDKYADTPVVDGLTLLVEIIYPDNKIITDYGDYDDLVLLGGTYLDGTWVSPDDIEFAGDKVSVEHANLGKVLSVEDPGNGLEGFIFKSDDGLMVKIKFPSYLVKHKARFSLSPNIVWENMRDGSFQELLLTLPDEFHDEAKGYKKKIVDHMNHLETQGKMWADKAPDGDRKTKAIWINSTVPYELKPLVMSMVVSGRDYTDFLLKYSHPRDM